MNIPDIAIRNLKNFKVIVQEGHLNKAAKKLNLTQPSLSRTILKLEEDLEVKLFDKSKYPWKLTKAGELFLQYAKIIEKEEQEFFEKIAKYKSKMFVNFGIMRFEEKSILAKKLDEIVDEVRKKYQNFELKPLVKGTVELETKLLDEEIDFAVIVSPPKNQGFELVPIKDYVVLLALDKNHPLAKDYIQPNDGKSFPYIDLIKLKETKFVFLLKEHNFHNIAVNYCKNAGFEPTIDFEVESIEVAHEFAGKNNRATFLLDETVKNNFNTNNVVYFRMKDDKDNNIKQTIAIAYKKDLKLKDYKEYCLKILTEKL